MTKILIVDDAIFMRKTLKVLLEKNDCTVIGEASDGEEALRQINALKPDVVTLDITMPKMDGLECLSRIQKLDDKPQVIMISAMGQKTKVIEAMQNGAKGFIVKPFGEDTVVSVLHKLQAK